MCYLYPAGLDKNVTTTAWLGLQVRKRLNIFLISIHVMVIGHRFLMPLIVQCHRMCAACLGWVPASGHAARDTFLKSQKENPQNCGNGSSFFGLCKYTSATSNLTAGHTAAMIFVHFFPPPGLSKGERGARSLYITEYATTFPGHVIPEISRLSHIRKILLCLMSPYCA